MAMEARFPLVKLVVAVQGIWAVGRIGKQPCSICIDSTEWKVSRSFEWRFAHEISGPTLGPGDCTDMLVQPVCWCVPTTAVFFFLFPRLLPTGGCGHVGTSDIWLWLKKPVHKMEPW